MHESLSYVFDTNTRSGTVVKCPFRTILTKQFQMDNAYLAQRCKLFVIVTMFESVPMALLSHIGMHKPYFLPANSAPPSAS